MQACEHTQCYLFSTGETMIKLFQHKSTNAHANALSVKRAWTKCNDVSLLNIESMLFNDRLSSNNEQCFNFQRTFLPTVAYLWGTHAAHRNVMTMLTLCDS